MGMDMGVAIIAVAAPITVGTAAISMVGTVATTMDGGTIAIGGDVRWLAPSSGVS